MKVRLQYGATGLALTVPDGADVLRPAPAPPLRRPLAAVHAAVAAVARGPRAARLGRPGQRAAIVVSDVTRLMPNSLVLAPILALLEARGVRRQDTTIIIGTGLHRPSREGERVRILGARLAARCRVVDHAARDPATLAPAGRTASGAPLALCRDYLAADVRVLTGFVEPHLFAGFSGGGKAVLPGIAGAEAILRNHDARMLAHPRATWCEAAGNPIFDEMRAAALATDPAFIVNVTLDERRRLTGVFAGELAAAHDAAIAAARRQAERPLARRADLVVVTNMGYPADLLLYQAVKGLSVAARACADGGAIVLCAECREGLGSPEYVAMLRRAAAPGPFLDALAAAPPVIDQWQVQVQALVQRRCTVYLHSALSPALVAQAHLAPAPDLDATVALLVAQRRRALGREPRVCVLPYGQLTVPVVEGDASP
ncbi:MAG TPA: nickel-dependent lactate racemase [Polyangia bacterium]|jgi:nickel-dependent lactate racemase